MRAFAALLVLFCGLGSPWLQTPQGFPFLGGGYARAQAPVRPVAGEVSFVAGSVQVSSGGQQRAPSVGDPVLQGDRLVTGASGHLHIKTVDKGFLALRPNSRARIEIYEFDPTAPAATRIRLKLENGVMRAVSGEGAQAARQNFRLNTPVAAIGIRGTDFSVSTTDVITRAVVRSGEIVVSAFRGDCHVEALGPCGGDTARQLSAAQAGKLIELRRDQREPALLDIRSGGGSPDQVAPPAPSEPQSSVPPDKVGPIGPQATAVFTEASLSVLLDSVRQESTGSVPPVSGGQPPVDPPTASVNWGRWQALVGVPAGVSADAFVAQNGPVVAINKLYLLTSTGAANLRLPVTGEFNFRLGHSEAYMVDVSGAWRPASVQGGALAVDFGRSRFSTSLDLAARSGVYAMTAQGRLSADGRFASNLLYTDGVTNASVRGALAGAQGERAAYLFDYPVSAGRSIVGAAGWQR